MQYRRFGKTELKMPVISTGGMRFQTSWNGDDSVKAESVANLEELVAHSLELGINHFETAHGYGTSEEELGQVLPHFERDKLIVQTKVSPKETVGEFSSQFDVSLKRLNLDYLDLFALHGLNNADVLEAAQRNGTIDRALQLKDKGVIRYLGFSSHGSPESIIDIINTGLFDYVNLWHSYIYQDNTPVFVAAQAQDMGVFIISPSDKGGHLHTPSERIVELCRPLSPMAFNDLFILENELIHTISCGASKATDLDLHVDAVNQAEAWRDLVTEVRGRLDETLNQVYDAHWAHHYIEGIPSWQAIPGQINIASILWLWNLSEAFDMVSYAKSRYNFLGNAGHWFPGQKADKLDQIPIADLREALGDSPFVDRILEILPQAHERFAGEEVKRLSTT